ncbi:hypothetical protein L5515_010890 [Caenorhabditis briggsae]|uniref:Uncharacterized protein n=1 Tax=Caenorhabditis briggsae TaxID=6238 RepID=A0AAE9ESL0_CAEBR|nr:hypothetical protein L5515_010890 [Caenorhabditis briggsae]
MTETVNISIEKFKKQSHSPFTHQWFLTLTDYEESGLQSINFDEASASNSIVAKDPEVSGLMYDEEGPGNHLLFDAETPIQVTNVSGAQAEPAAAQDSKGFSQTINVAGY